MMTFIASILFLTALAASVLAIAATMSDAMPRIVDVIEAEFAPAVRTERRITFGPVKQRTAMHSAEVIAFPTAMRVETDFRLAA